MTAWVYSATQVENFLLCRRNWAFQKIEGIKPPPKPSQQEGIDVHEQLDGWLKHGKPLDMLSAAGKVAMAGLHLLPAPMTAGLESETISYVSIGGWRFVVKKDWQRLNLVPPVVSDHKTTKDFRWMKTAEILKTDVQACLYAAEAMLATGVPVVDLQWTYFRTRGAPKAEPVYVRVTAEDIAPTVEKICDTVAEMQMIFDLGLRALDLPPSAESCDAFGGCPFQSKCNLTPEERLISIMTQAQRSQDFLTIMQQRSAGQVNPPPQGQPPAGPPPVVQQQQQQPPAGPPGPQLSHDGRFYVDPHTNSWQPVPAGAAPGVQQPAQSFPEGPAQFQQQPPAGPPEGAAPARRKGGRPTNAERAARAAAQAPGATSPVQPPAGGLQPPAGPPAGVHPPSFGEWGMSAQQPPAGPPGPPPQLVLNPLTNAWELPPQGPPPGTQQQQPAGPAAMGPTHAATGIPLPPGIIPDTPMTRAIYTNGGIDPNAPIQHSAPGARLVGDPAEAAADDTTALIADLTAQLKTLVTQHQRAAETLQAIADRLVSF